MTTDPHGQCCGAEPNGEAEAPTKAPALKGFWTCPMHPDVQSDEPGNCPICGMALEQIGGAEDPAADHELHDMQRRLWVSAVLTLPVFVLAMGDSVDVFTLDPGAGEFFLSLRGLRYPKKTRLLSIRLPDNHFPKLLTGAYHWNSPRCVALRGRLPAAP